jgi:hypothetical protein
MPQLSTLRPALIGRFRPLFALASWYVCLGLVLRVVLWAAFGRVQQVSALALPGLLASGVLCDLVQSFYLLTPFAIFLWLAPERLYGSRIMRPALLTGAFLWMFALTFVAAIE